MAQIVFRPGQANVGQEKVMLPLVKEYAPIEEPVQDLVEEYHGPTADDLRREAEKFKSQWEAEKAQMYNEAQVAADEIIKKAEETAFEEVKRQTDQAAVIKADAETEAQRIIDDAKAEAAKIVADAKAENCPFTIKFGIYNGKVVDADEVKKLASIPSREVLLTQVASGLIGTVRNLSIALDLLAKQKENN